MEICRLTKILSPGWILVVNILNMSHIRIFSHFTFRTRNVEQNCISLFPLMLFFTMRFAENFFFHQIERGETCNLGWPVHERTGPRKAPRKSFPDPGTPKAADSAVRADNWPWPRSALKICATAAQTLQPYTTPDGLSCLCYMWWTKFDGNFESLQRKKKC